MMCILDRPILFCVCDVFQEMGREPPSSGMVLISQISGRNKSQMKEQLGGKLSDAIKTSQPRPSICATTYGNWATMENRDQPLTFCRWCRGLSLSPSVCVLKYLKYLPVSLFQFFPLCAARSPLPPVRGIVKTENNKCYRDSHWIRRDKKFIRRQLANDVQRDEFARTKGAW